MVNEGEPLAAMGPPSDDRSVTAGRVRCHRPVAVAAVAVVTGVLAADSVLAWTRKS